MHSTNHRTDHAPRNKCRQYEQINRGLVEGPPSTVYGLKKGLSNFDISTLSKMIVCFKEHFWSLFIGLTSGWVRLFHCGVGKDKEVKRTGGQGVQASLLGVGAPEALVIGVVALLVFGPKGLAEVWESLSQFLLLAAPSSSSI